MKFALAHHIVVIILASLPFISGEVSNNLSCFQCERNTTALCDPHELQPCPPVSDRCVTHISKSAQSGFSIKRECGLGPCGFDDDMANKGLGFGICDQSRPEYFCIFCCKESGCNESNSLQFSSSLLAILLVLTVWKNKVFA